MKHRQCERCGELLPDDAPQWKKLCYACWKKTFTKENNIRQVMERLKESSIIQNKNRKW